MNCKQLSVIALAVASLITSGCQTTRTAGRKARQVAVTAPRLFVKGLVDDIFDRDETIFEKERRERRERQWKQYWRDHPNENPAMHEAFKDDYE